MSNISKLHRYSNEREIEHRAFLLWAMQAKLNRNVRAISRAVGRSHTSVSNYLNKHNWGSRVTSLTDEAEAQALYKSLYMPEYGMTEISAVQKYIATPISTSGTLDRAIGESVQKAINKTSKKIDKVHEKEVQRKHIMLLDAAIGYIAQGLKDGDMKRQIRDLPTLINLRNQISDIGTKTKNGNTIVYESVRVKTAKDHGSDIVEAMYEDAKELTAILGSLKGQGAYDSVHKKDGQNSGEVLKLVPHDKK